MSAFSRKGKERSVVPRWRSFLNTPSTEVITLNRFPSHEKIDVREFQSLIEVWRKRAKSEDAVDIMDAGIASGSRQLMVEGAKRVLSFGQNQVQKKVFERAESILFKRPGYRHTAQVPTDEENAEELYPKISRLKRDIAEQQRNPLAHIEIARLYSRLAQFDKAEFHIRIAALLAPNDRFVLRAVTRYFTMLDGHREALSVLRRSEVISYDPWVQSAELSAAVLGHENPRFAQAGVSKLGGHPQPKIETSELVIGWTTYRHDKGLSSKNALRALRSSLSDSTENASAQAIWFADAIGRDLQTTFPGMRLGADAHEARSMTALESGQYEVALAEATSWFLDQPFQVRSSVQISFISLVYLNDYEKSLQAARAGLTLHPNDWLLVNFCVISCAYLGNFDAAKIFLTKFERLAESDDEANVFLMAAKGLLAFQQGRFLTGLQFYTDAIRKGQKIGRGDLSVNACVYLLEMACRHQLVSEVQRDEMAVQINKALNSLSPARRKSISDVWKARYKTMIAPVSLVEDTLFSLSAIKGLLEELR